MYEGIKLLISLLRLNHSVCFPGTCFHCFFSQSTKLIITKLVSDESTILQSDNLWLIICLMLEKMLCMLSDCGAIQGAPSPLWQNTLLMMPFIFLSPTTVIKAMQMNWWINAQFGLSSKYLPAFLTGNKPRVIDSVWSESPPSSPCMKNSVSMWKLTSTYCPHCEGSGVSVDFYTRRQTAVTCFLFIH